MEKHTLSFVSLSDVLEYMGYPDIPAADVFQNVSFGDAAYTIMSLQWVLDELYDYLDCDDYRHWTDEQARQFTEKSLDLCAKYDYVDMES